MPPKIKLPAPIIRREQDGSIMWDMILNAVEYGIYLNHVYCERTDRLYLPDPTLFGSGELTITAIPSIQSTYLESKESNSITIGRSGFFIPQGDILDLCETVDVSDVNNYLYDHWYSWTGLNNDYMVVDDAHLKFRDKTFDTSGSNNSLRYLHIPDKDCLPKVIASTALQSYDQTYDTFVATEINNQYKVTNSAHINDWVYQRAKKGMLPVPGPWSLNDVAEKRLTFSPRWAVSGQESEIWIYRDQTSDEIVVHRVTPEYTQKFGTDYFQNTWKLNYVPKVVDCVMCAGGGGGRYGGGGGGGIAVVSLDLSNTSATNFFRIFVGASGKYVPGAAATNGGDTRLCYTYILSYAGSVTYTILTCRGGKGCKDDEGGAGGDVEVSKDLYDSATLREIVKIKALAKGGSGLSNKVGQALMTNAIRICDSNQLTPPSATLPTPDWVTMLTHKIRDIPDSSNSITQTYSIGMHSGNQQREVKRIGGNSLGRGGNVNDDDYSPDYGGGGCGTGTFDSTTPQDGGYGLMCLIY